LLDAGSDEVGSEGGDIVGDALGKSGAEIAAGCGERAVTRGLGYVGKA